GLAGVLGPDGAPTGAGDGIETLTVLLGANNALKTVIELKVEWSRDGEFADLEAKDAFTVWRPDHFRAELAELVAQLKEVRARHVILGTVPHVTIAPIARGVDRKVAPGSRYFPFYTRPWIRDQDFDPARDPHITAAEARAIDSAIDHYNDAITEAVRQARREGRDWYLLDVAGLLDRLAARRYQLDPSARPEWWEPYPLPPALAALDPVPDSRFFVSGAAGRMQGGLFSLDGVHPTTILYGLMAQEFMNVMQLAGVEFAYPTGTVRPGPVEVDFERLKRLDTLISDPPRSLSADLRLLGWFDERFDAFRRMFARG
ncbi:MAG TPA: hypothetical protein VN238_18825, partial [Solirubrobacteraceae bacterium]|nr:hypothetical protein [Solirubrobacteraceae bacterium]